MTETERIAHAVYERNIHPRLHFCHTSRCPNLVAGHDFCARCEEEMNGQICTFAEIIGDMPKWALLVLGIAVCAIACVMRNVL